MRERGEIIERHLARDLVAQDAARENVHAPTTIGKPG